LENASRQPTKNLSEPHSQAFCAGIGSNTDQRFKARTAPGVGLIQVAERKLVRAGVMGFIWPANWHTLPARGTASMQR
jgi:hypothetical protein